MGTALKYRVLVLNRLWQPVNIVGVERAFSLLLQDHAQVIYTADENFRLMDSVAWLALSKEASPENNGAYIQTVRLRIRLPKVLLLRSYDKLPTQEIKFTRDNLFERDDHRCQYCGNHLGAVHLDPQVMGSLTKLKKRLIQRLKQRLKQRVMQRRLEKRLSQRLK